MSFWDKIQRKRTGRYSLPFHVPPAGSPALMSPVEVEIAIERSRLGAALIYAQDEEKRLLAESIWGIDYMKYTYPEAYPRTCARFIDNFSIPWVR